jgi:hypothetical protein
MQFLFSLASVEKNSAALGRFAANLRAYHIDTLVIL